MPTSGGERLASKKPSVHPSTSFDHNPSTLSTPNTSDNEAEMSEIKRAQNMSINLSPIDCSVPNRAIRMVLRGDFGLMQKEAIDGTRRARMYLVATDLSGEAVYALEWTIGTILRDGDTLFAVYAVDEEVGTGKVSEHDARDGNGVEIGQGAQAMQDATSVMDTLTEKTKMASSGAGPSPLASTSLVPATESTSRAGSRDARCISKAAQERLHAVDSITQTCVRLLRKTRLQVRVAIEVIHCKSPKHMITEAVSQPS